MQIHPQERQLKQMNFNRKSNLKLLVAAIIACTSLTVGSGVASAAVSPAITGSGSTLVAPLVTEWNTRLGGGITYGGGGSGKGLSDIAAGTTDFGASDAPMTSDQAAKCGACQTIPVSLNAAGLTYNLPGVNHLKLTADLVAAIYKGQISTWNDAKIQKLNKGVALPATKITPVHRLDGSGTTYAFVRWLSSAVKSWRSSPGFGTLVAWPAGVGTAASGNGGIANAVRTTEGAVGYVGVDYMIPNKLPAAQISNAAGKFLYPNLKNVIAAGNTATKVPKNGAIMVVNPPKKFPKAYPIAAFSFVVAKKGSPNIGGVKQMIDYAIGKGRGLRADIGFAPLPKSVVAYSKGALKKL
jgi:phosphate transport system substrate-binding protein